MRKRVGRYAVTIQNHPAYWVDRLDPAPRHPSQLYEAVLEGVVLLLYIQWRFWRTDARKIPGRLSGEFLVLYACVRILCEQFREPDAGLIFGMNRGVFFSLFLLAAGAVVILYSSRYKASSQLSRNTDGRS